MRFLSLLAALLLFVTAPVPAQTFTVPVEYFKLDNGLKVVVSPDRSAPVVLVEVIYNIGFRVEPKGRTGFAHLFEHMMFQGSANVKKMQHVSLMQEAGGVVNGSTRFDYTNYFQSLPSNGARARDVSRSRSHALARRHRREPEEPAERGQRGSARQRPQPAARRVRLDRDLGARQHQLAQRPRLLRRPRRARGRHARRRARVLQDLLRAEQRRARGRRRYHRRRGASASPRSTSDRSRSQPQPAPADLSEPPQTAPKSARAPTSWRARRRSRWPGTCRRG